MVAVGYRQVFFLVQMDEEDNNRKKKDKGIVQIDQGYKLPVPVKAVAQGKLTIKGWPNSHHGFTIPHL
jgi:hypothetical protein